MTCVYKILYLDTLSFRYNNEEKKLNFYENPYSIRKDIKEIIQIFAIWVLKMRFREIYVFLRRKEFKEIREIYLGKG